MKKILFVIASLLWMGKCMADFKSFQGIWQNKIAGGVKSCVQQHLANDFKCIESFLKRQAGNELKSFQWLWPDKSADNLRSSQDNLKFFQDKVCSFEDSLKSFQSFLEMPAPDDFALFQSVRQKQYDVTSLFLFNRSQLTSLEPLKYFPNVQTLTIICCPRIRKIIPPIGAHTALRALYFSPSLKTDISALSRFTALEQLSLPLSSIDNIKYLTHLDLKVLDLSMCKHIRDLHEIGSFQNLEKLDMCSCSYFDDPKNKLEFLRKNKNLTYLNIRANDEIRDLSPVFSLSKLTTLILGNNADRGASLEGIKNLKNLKNLHLGSFVQKKDLEHIRSLKNLVNVSYNKWLAGEKYAKVLKKHLPNVTITEDVTIAENNIITELPNKKG